MSLAVYVGSSIDNKRWADDVAHAARARGHDVVSIWHATGAPPCDWERLLKTDALIWLQSDFESTPAEVAFAVGANIGCYVVGAPTRAAAATATAPGVAFHAEEDSLFAELEIE